jgi:hypothetical protein
MGGGRPRAHEADRSAGRPGRDRNDGRQLADVPPHLTTPSTTAGPETAESFVQRLATAIGGADREFLYERLHPDVVTLYGEQACRDHLGKAFAAPTETTPGTVAAPADWTWMADGRTTVVSGATAADLQFGARVETLHVAPSEGLFRWFTDCGVPR